MKSDNPFYGKSVEIVRQIGDNQYLAEVNGVRCTAIFNCFTGHYYVDDVYGIQKEDAHG